MKNSFGNAITLTIFGESHGPMIGGVLDGLPAGFKIDIDQLNQDMRKRKAKGKISTQRHEDDAVQIVSGYFNGYTTGTALTLLIENKAQHSQDYSALKDRLRPSHADWSAFEKYHGFQDYRGGGHFSGRLSAVMVAAGSICRQILKTKGVKIGSHLKQIHTIEDRSFAHTLKELDEQIDQVNQMDFPVLDRTKEARMKAHIEEIAFEKDSVGGLIESAITHFPAGIGEPIFDSLESTIAHALFSIPAVKGVSFGLGFDFIHQTGSQANDPLILVDGKIQTLTNNNGGINGGISNSMPIRLQTIIKPTPSIFKVQRSVQYTTKEEVDLCIEGRHDPCIAHRALIVIDSLLAFCLLDLWMAQAGKAYFEETFYAD